MHKKQRLEFKNIKIEKEFLILKDDLVE